METPVGQTAILIVLSQNRLPRFRGARTLRRRLWWSGWVDTKLEFESHERAREVFEILKKKSDVKSMVEAW